MQVQTQIDRLIENLEALKVSLSQPSASQSNTFAQNLDSAMADIEKISETVVGNQNAFSPDMGAQVIVQDAIPAWFDPSNPKKPSTMQLMEIMTGQEPSEIFEREDFKKLSHEASDMLYGAIGSNVDKRDWGSIMTSGSIINALRTANSELLSPSVTVESIFSSNGEPTKSVVTVTDHDGNKLRVMQGEQANLVNTLQNMGITASSLVSDLQGVELSDLSAATRDQFIDFIS